MNIGSDARIKFYERGEKGPAQFDAGAAAFESSAFRGLQVVTAVPYELSDDMDAVQMLQRSTQVGEYYVMSAPEVFDAKKALSPQYMDIQIYDEEHDKQVVISFKKALYMAFPIDKRFEILPLIQYTDVTDPAIVHMFEHIDGMSTEALDKVKAALKAANDGTALTDAAAVRDFAKQIFCTPAVAGNPAAAAATAAAAETDPTARANAKAAIALKVLTGILAMVAAGVWVPVEIVLARPFIEHLMMSAIMMVAGRETGATLFGPAGARCARARGSLVCRLRARAL